MLWSEVRKSYPNMWVVVEALKSDEQANEKTIKEVALLNAFTDSEQAYRNYTKIHKLQPQKDYVFASTVNETLKVKMLYWAGVRGKR